MDQAKGNVPPTSLEDLGLEVVATHRPMGIEDTIAPRRVAAISCRCLFPSEIHKHDSSWIRGHADFRPRRACDTAARPGPGPRWRCVFALSDSLGPLVSTLTSERVNEPASTAPLNFTTLRFRRPDRGATETTPVRSQ